MSTQEIFAGHKAWVDNLVRGFESEMQNMVASAQAQVITALRERLAMTRGVIDRTPANQRVLRQIDDLLMAALERAGFQQLSEEFVKSFPGQMPYFEQILDQLSSRLNRPLKVAFGKADTDLFASQQISTLESLQTVVESVAASAKRKALFSVGALDFADMADQIARSFNRSISEATTLAETSVVMFHRTVTERGFKQIEKDLPKGAVRYRYEGPRDKLTRDFCQRMLSRTAREPLTRAQIERLDNGQLPNPFITGGGYNCRHQWVITEIRDGGKKA